jgi:hypothetical protein
MKSSLRGVHLGLGALLIFAGLVGWIGLSRMGEVEGEMQALAEKMGNPALAALLADPAGPDRLLREAGEIRKLKDEVSSLDEKTAVGWAQAGQEASGDGQDWSKDSGKWKDRLIEIQNRLQKEAPQRKVILNPDFYLGLEAYRQKSPTEQEVPALALELSVAARLVDQLFLARQANEQYPTVCEFQSLSGPASLPPKASETNPPPGGNRPGALHKSPDRKEFRLQIRCSPEVLYEYVRRLTQDSWLFILTDLELSNSKQKFPLRSEIAKNLETGMGAGPSSSADAGNPKRLLEVLAGEEAVNAVLFVDFVYWKNPNPAPPKTSASP